MNSFYDNLYKSMTNKEKERLDKSAGNLLLTPRIQKIYRNRGKDITLDIVAIIPTLLFLFMLWFFRYMAMERLESMGASDFVIVAVNGIFFLWSAACLMLYFIDTKALECYFIGYNKSSYFLSTGTRQKQIRSEKGLIGEFKAYMLSRTLTVPHKVLYNVCVPMDNGNFQEIDSMIITRRMIYVLECKNMEGEYIGTYDDKEWTQIIGSQEHTKPNVYLQNQLHTMTLDKFLLDRGIIQNGQNVCINMALISGSIKFPQTNIPMDFRFGSMRKLSSFINTYDKQYSSQVEGNGLIDTAYEALLPYALYTDTERKAMIEERAARKESGEFTKGAFREVAIEGGIPGITPPDKITLLRYNRLFTQIQISDGKSTCWQTRTDIPDEYLQ